MSIKVLVVDDHQIVREGLGSLLGRQPDMALVGEAGDGDAALRQAGELLPDVVIVDIHLTGMDGIEASRQILTRLPQTKILILSGLADRELVNRALQAGVSGYLLKGNASDEILWAIRAMMAGKIYLCPEVATPLVAEYASQLAAKPAPAKPRLSERELQVLKLTAEGLRTKEIAERMKIGPRTVETYRARLMQKVGCHGNVELTRYAVREGIVS